MSPDVSFSTTFRQNMADLGLPVPSVLFEHYSIALGNAAQMAAILPLLDRQATVSDLVGKTLGLEKLMVAGDYSARGYTAAVISSLALASGQLAGGQAPMAALFRFTYQNQLQFPGWHHLFRMNPALNDPGAAHSSSFGSRARFGLV